MGQKSHSEAEEGGEGGGTGQSDLVSFIRSNKMNDRKVNINPWGHGRFRSDHFPLLTQVCMHRRMLGVLLLRAQQSVRYFCSEDRDF